MALPPVPPSARTNVPPLSWKSFAAKLARLTLFCTQLPPVRLNRPTLTAAGALMALPALSTSPPFGAVIAAFRLIALKAVSVMALPLDQPSALLTLMSPLPADCTPGPLALVALVVSVTLLVARLALIVPAAAASIVRSVGSTSQVPVLPCAADVSTRTPVKSTTAPDVSTVPPSPGARVEDALRIPFATRLCPIARIEPALPVLLDTSIVPPSVTLPAVPVTVCAFTLAGRLTMPRTAARASAVVSKAVLPSLLIMAVSGSATLRKPLPLRSKVARVTAPTTTRPAGAAISPLLATLPPSRPTKPPVAVVMVPALDTAPPLPSAMPLPAMNAASSIPSVDATNPRPTLTTPDLVIWMPLGLTR